MQVRSFTTITALFVSIVFLAHGAMAQLNSNQGAVNLNAVMGESVTISGAPATVNFTPLDPNGVTNGDAAITITTTWTLQPSRTTLSTYAYFATTTALTNTTDVSQTIASSRVEGQVGAGAFSSFTGNSPFATGSSLPVAAVPINGTNKTGTRNDTLTLRIDTSGSGLSAGTYTGTLFVQAEAI